MIIVTVAPEEIFSRTFEFINGNILICVSWFTFEVTTVVPVPVSDGFSVVGVCVGVSVGVSGVVV